VTPNLSSIPLYLPVAKIPDIIIRIAESIAETSENVANTLQTATDCNRRLLGIIILNPDINLYGMNSNKAYYYGL